MFIFSAVFILSYSVQCSQVPLLQWNAMYHDEVIEIVMSNCRTYRYSTGLWEERQREKQEKEKVKQIHVLMLMSCNAQVWISQRLKKKRRWHSQNLTSIICTACDDVKQTKRHWKETQNRNKTKSGNKHYKNLHKIKKNECKLKIKSDSLKGC